MINVPFLDLRRQIETLSTEIMSRIADIIKSGRFVSGKYVGEFEKAFAGYLGVKHCVSVSSGTAALQLALMAHGIGPGDEVLVPANTFIATAEAVSLVGATPVFVDIDKKTYTLNCDKLEEAITMHTKAVIPVHLYGQCADMDCIKEIAQKNGLIVIEDASQAHGAEYKGRKAGSMGDAAAFSFYPGKNLGSFGEGGAVVTNNDRIAEKVRMLSDHGSRVKYRHELVGGNFRMSEIQGAVLLVKLGRLDEWNKRRRNNAQRYDELLGEVKEVITPYEAEHNKHIYHLYVIRSEKRDGLQEFLRAKGVGTLIHYPIPLHLQEAYAPLNIEEGSLPASEEVQREVLSLPMFPELREEEIVYVSEKIREYFGRS